MPAKTKRIGQRGIDHPLLCFVKGEVQPAVNFRIIRKMVDGRRNDIILYSQDSGNGFDGTRCAQEVAGHRFGGIDVDFVSLLPKQRLNSFWLNNISQRG